MAAYPASYNDEHTAESTLSISNLSGDQVQLVWINWEGQEQLYNVLEPESETSQGKP